MPLNAWSYAELLDVPLRRLREKDRQEADGSLDAVHDEILSLFDQHARSLRTFVGSCGVPAACADDVVQETFVALYRHLCRGGDRSNLRAWLFRVSYRLGLKQRRRAWRLLQWQVSWHPAVGQAPAGRDTNPETRVLHQERCRTVRAVFAALPERDRQCFHLRAEGFRYRQIADILGISLGTVAKSLARGMAKLATVVKESER